MRAEVTIGDALKAAVAEVDAAVQRRSALVAYAIDSGATYRAIAELLGVSKSTVHRWANGPSSSQQRDRPARPAGSGLVEGRRVIGAPASGRMDGMSDEQPRVERTKAAQRIPVDARYKALGYALGCVRPRSGEPVALPNVAWLVEEVAAAVVREDPQAALVHGTRLLDEAQVAQLVAILRPAVKPARAEGEEQADPVRWERTEAGDGALAERGFAS